MCSSAAAGQAAGRGDDAAAQEQERWQQRARE